MQHQVTDGVPPRLADSCALSALSANEQGAVTMITAGKEALRRMASLGFTPGAAITMIQNPGYGPLIVLVRNVRVALGRGEAQKIQVRRLA